MSLRNYILRRILISVPLIFVIIIINFSIIHMAPGDPVTFMISGMEEAPREFIEEVRLKLGLDKPLHMQLLTYVWNILHGDLGFSYIYHMSVSQVISRRLLNTLLLTLTSFALAVIFGLFSGIVASRKPYSLRDSLLSIGTLITWSTPSFWLGLILLMIFGLNLRWFPLSGITSVETSRSIIVDILWHLFLPATCLVLGRMALYARITRASLLECLHENYILTARSKGCSENTVFHKHALRNALLPIITYIGLRIQNLFAGQVLVETVFGWPGVGLLIYESILARDFAMIQAIFLIISIVTIAGNLIADVLYAFADPRIRYG